MNPSHKELIHGSRESKSTQHYSPKSKERLAQQLPEMTCRRSLSFAPSGPFIRHPFLSFSNNSIFSPLFLQIEDMRLEVQRKEQDLMQLQAKMKTVEEQHADYQKHIAVLKESLIAKEEHYNMLQMDVSSSSMLYYTPNRTRLL